MFRGHTNLEIRGGLCEPKPSNSEFKQTSTVGIMAGMQFQVARLDSTLYEAADGWKSIHAFIEHLLSSSADRSGLVLVVGELPGAAEEVNRIFESIVTSGNQNWESEVNVLEERHTAAAKASGLSSLPSAAKSSFDALRKLLLGVSLVREGSHRVRAQVCSHSHPCLLQNFHHNFLICFTSLFLRLWLS